MAIDKVSGQTLDAALLEGSNKATVQDHTPKAHSLASHSSEAHSELSGVGATDHHTAAILHSLLTTRGDIIFRNATVPARLAKGSSGNVLTMGADDPAWTAPAAGGPTIATGTYSGTGSSRQITVGFKCSYVVILHPSAPRLFLLIPNATVFQQGSTTQDKTSVLYLHATDGFQVGTNYFDANESSQTYYYWAISE